MAAALEFQTIGEVLVDFSQCGTGPQGYPCYEALPGGAPANVAVALAKWGRRAGFLGLTGADTLGGLLAETLRKQGVDCSGLLAGSAPTSLAMVSLDAEGDRSFAFYWKETSCAALPAGLVDRVAVGPGGVFHFGSVTLSQEASAATTLAAARAAKARGATVSFDANLRPGLWGGDADRAREPMRAALALADIAKVSEEELYFLAGLDPAAAAGSRDAARTVELAERLRKDSGVAALFVTFGKDGVRWTGAGGGGALDTLKVKPVDTTGAGDCFMAGVLHRFLGIGKPAAALGAAELRAMAAQGVASGALSTEKRGAIPSIPTLAEVAARLPA